MSTPDGGDQHPHDRPPDPGATHPTSCARSRPCCCAGDGDLLPVSALPVDGVFPTATAQYEKRSIAKQIPIWDPDVCIDCGKCAIVCPHATIRMKVFDTDAVADAPPDFLHKAFRSKDLADHRLTIQVAPDDCTGCGVCVDVCPAKSKTDVSPQGHQHGAGHRAPRRRAGALGLLPDHPPPRPRPAPPRHGQGLPGARAAVRVLRCLRRLRRDPVPEAGVPAVRRPHDRRQRHRLLVDLRRQPADHAVDGERRGPGPGVEQLALRGQRRVRPRACASRSTSRARRPARSLRRLAPHLGGDLVDAHPRQPPGQRGRDRGRSATLVDRAAGRSSPTSPTGTRPRSRPRTCCRWRATSCARASGSSAATAGPTTSASAASTTCCRPDATSTSSCSTPRCTPTPAARPPRRPRGRGGQVRGRRQGHRQEGPGCDRPGLRQRLRRPGVHGRQRAADDQGAARGRRLARARRWSSPTAPASPTASTCRSR